MPSRRARWPALLLVPLCAALYLPGLHTLPPVDRDEARYLRATREMLAGGAPLVPTLQGTPRLAKPIGIYWLQAAALRATGMREALAAQRLPSVLGALVAVLGTFAIGRRWFAGAAPLLGAAALAASALLVSEAHLATTDAALLAAVVVAQSSLASLYGAVRRNRRGQTTAAAGFWAALAAGVLLKGPVLPLVALLTAVTLTIADRRLALLAALRPWWGVPLALLLIAPWPIAVAAELGWPRLTQAMAGDLLPKLVGGHESHGLPPGTYLLLTPIAFWPASLALLFAAAAAWRRRRRPAERFLLAWLLPTWVVLELVPTKLPHYMLPLFPALALLVARAACGAPARIRPAPTSMPMRALELLWGCGTAAAGVALLIILRQLDAPIDSAALLTAAAGIAVAVAGTAAAWRGRLAAACGVAIVGAVAFYASLLATLPGADAMWPSRAAAVAVAAAGAERPLAAVGYHEPSLLVVAPGDVALLDAEAAAAFVAAQPDALVLVSADQRTAFVAATRGRGLRLRTLWSAPGINYSKGEHVDLHLFAAER